MILRFLGKPSVRKTIRHIKVSQEKLKKTDRVIVLLYQEAKAMQTSLTQSLATLWFGNINKVTQPPHKSLFTQDLLYLVYWTNPWPPNLHAKMISIRKRKQKNAPTGGWPTPGSSPRPPPSTWAWFVTTSGRNHLLKVCTWLACWLGVLRLELWLTGLGEK